MAPLREIVTRPIAAAEDDVLDNDDRCEYSAPVPDCVEDVDKGGIKVCSTDDRNGNETRFKCDYGGYERIARQRDRNGAYMASEIMV